MFGTEIFEWKTPLGADKRLQPYTSKISIQDQKKPRKVTPTPLHSDAGSQVSERCRQNCVYSEVS